MGSLVVFVKSRRGIVDVFIRSWFLFFFWICASCIGMLIGFFYGKKFINFVFFKLMYFDIMFCSVFVDESFLV